MSARHPLMQFFTYAHLKAPLAEVSRPFCELAEKLAAMDEHTRKDDGYSLVYALKMLVLGGWPAQNAEAEWAAQKLAEAEDRCLEQYNIDDVLRSVLEAKDCAVRAVLFKAEG